MKILLILNYGWNYGGAEVYTSGLRDELIRQGNEVKILCSDNEQSTKELFADYTFKESKLGLFRSIAYIFNPVSFFATRRAVQQFKPDVVHIQSIDQEVSSSVLLATHRIPTIMTLHSYSLMRPYKCESHPFGECELTNGYKCMDCIGLRASVHARLKFFVNMRFLSKIDLFISPSAYFTERYGSLFSNIKHVPNGIDLPSFSPITNQASILYVGRLAPDKGVEYLVGAFGLIHKNHSDATLTIVGNGSEMNKLEGEIRDLGIGKSVRFAGTLTPSKVLDYYRDSTVIVVPSIYPDNFPTVCLEAMAIGRPIVASNIGGLPELVINNVTGFLVKPKNPESIAESIDKLLASRVKINRMGKAAHKRSANFNIEKHVTLIEGLYIELCKK